MSASLVGSGRRHPSDASNYAPSPHRIRIGHYILDRTLGKGTFGKVKLAYHQVTQHQVAVKILNRRKIKQQEVVNKIKREIQNLKLVHHPHIIKLYQAISSPTEFYIVMEYVPGGELFDYIVKKGRLQEPEARKIFQQIISGVDYCHRHGVVHRDLKPENLLLDANGNVRIADFGLSNVISDGEFLKTSCGSPNYAAPEVITGRLYAGPEIDVWSCGVILYTLVCGVLPFDDDHVPTLFKKIKNGRFHCPEYLSIEVMTLLRKMLVVEQAKRITIAEIRNSKWFQKDLADYLFPDELVSNRDVIDMEIVQEVVRKFTSNLRIITESDVIGAIQATKRDGLDRKMSRHCLANLDLDGINSHLVGTKEFNDPIYVAYCMFLDAKIFQAAAPDFYKVAKNFNNPKDLTLLTLDKKAHSEAPLKNPENAVKSKSFKWHLGIRSRAQPWDIMHEVYKALKKLGFQWKVHTYFLIDVRRKVGDTNRYAHMTLQLYQMDIRTYLIDFANKIPQKSSNVQPPSSPPGTPEPNRKNVEMSSFIKSNEVSNTSKASEFSLPDSINLQPVHNTGNDGLPAPSYGSSPEQIPECHDNQGRVILKTRQKVRPNEHVVMEFFEMCSDIIKALAGG